MELTPVEVGGYEKTINKDTICELDPDNLRLGKANVSESLPADPTMRPLGYKQVGLYQQVSQCIGAIE